MCAIVCVLVHPFIWRRKATLYRIDDDDDDGDGYIAIVIAKSSFSVHWCKNQNKNKTKQKQQTTKKYTQQTAVHRTLECIHILQLEVLLHVYILPISIEQ